MATNYVDLAAVRDALADLLKQTGFEVMPRWDGLSIPSRMPCLVVQPTDEPVAYHGSFAGGMATIRLGVTAFVSFTEDGALLLDRLMSSGAGADPGSINDLIESDRPNNGGTSLGGLVQELAVLDPVRWRGSVVFDAADGARAWSAEWIVSLYQPHKRTS